MTEQPGANAVNNIKSSAVYSAVEPQCIAALQNTSSPARQQSINYNTLPNCLCTLAGSPATPATGQQPLCSD
ncbi:MAG: hypothetical protein LBV26_04570, partial [Bacteroidales bacterium]|nr:hypothetical protein [Bacteroidales bacterium]